SPDGATAYVASCGADFGTVVDVIDTRTNKVTRTRKIDQIGGLVTRLSVGGNGARAYLVSEDRVTVLNTRDQDIIGTVRAGQPSCVVESRDGSRLYIADNSGTVSVTPVAAGLSGSEVDGPASDVSTAWIVPELLQYEAALA
ncbi:YncE family protein, partial [Mycobacterium simiae]|uniref:YncE family protein n=1 Tax=Mycobacterium simiae TaxID=1784 RepID=UPI0035901F5E